MREIQLNLLPFYVVCDESYSMAGEPMKALNDALVEVHREVGQNPVVCDKTRFAVIGFSDHAEVIQPLEDMQELSSLPQLSPKGGTSFKAAFQLLRTEIEENLDQLKADGHRVFRPVVFFLTDGYPTDETQEWEAALNDLTAEAFRYHPNMLAFGIGSADAACIAKIGRTKAFTVDPAMSPAQALKEFAVALTKSIIASGTSASANPTLQVAPISGFTELPTDEV